MFVALGSTIEAVLYWRQKICHASATRAAEPCATTAIAQVIYNGDGVTAREAMRDIVVEVRTAFDSQLQTSCALTSATYSASASLAAAHALVCN